MHDYVTPYARKSIIGCIYIYDIGKCPCSSFPHTCIYIYIPPITAPDRSYVRNSLTIPQGAKIINKNDAPLSECRGEVMEA